MPPAPSCCAQPLGEIVRPGEIVSFDPGEERFVIVCAEVPKAPDLEIVPVDDLLCRLLMNGRPLAMVRSAEMPRREDFLLVDRTTAARMGLALSTG